MNVMNFSIVKGSHHCHKLTKSLFVFVIFSFFLDLVHCTKAEVEVQGVGVAAYNGIAGKKSPCLSSASL